jgi:molecular chaperone GrpE
MSRKPDATPESDPVAPADTAAGATAAQDAPESAATDATDGQIAALEAERDTLKDRLLRALAEAENARKRGERDRREAQDYGATRLARDLLPIYDHLTRALDAMGEVERAAAPSVVEGIELTRREMLNAFARHGIVPVAPEPGDPFDPARHEAMFEAPMPGHAPGAVIQMMTEGFTIHDRLLRPAQVGVASAAVAPAGSG